MQYPVKLCKVHDELSIFIPDQLTIKSTYEHLVQKDANTPFPFWAKIWASSIALCDFLQEHTHWVKDKTVLELGAGIGLPSFQIAKMVKAVIISDHNSDAVELIEKNIALLDLNNAKAVLLDWNTMDYALTVDTILLSDVNYDPLEFDSLLQIIKHYLAKDAVIILSTPTRIMGIPLIESLQDYIQHDFAKSIRELENEVEIRVYVLSNKHI
jgi:predicted nicotinamide N-methyase